MITAHPVFKHSKFVCLSTQDKTTYLSYKLQNYFNSKNKFCPDANGMSTKIYTHQVCITDFYNDVSKLFTSSYKLVEHKQFVGQQIKMNEPLKRLLKCYDLEKAFEKCFETFVFPIFSKLKTEIDNKKQLEILRVEENKKMLEIQQKKIIEEKNAEKEKEIKLSNFKASVLALGAEWEEEEEA
jgi:hypothetical protein